jgi:hypothetical protein
LRFASRSTFVALVTVFVMSAFTAAPALASGKPFVETKPATSIGETIATLNGVVNPNGAETKYHFEYGTTTSYGKKTTEVSVGSGVTNLEESQAIKELAQFTTYHFRIVATNSNGTTDGADEVFSTTPKPGLPEFVPAGEGTFPITVSHTNNGTTPVSFENNGGTKYECKGMGVQGEITDAKTVPMTLTVTHCASGTENITSDGAKEGEDIFPGTGHLVYLNKSATQVAILFMLKEAHLHVGLVEFSYRGSLVIPVTPPNTQTSQLHIEMTGKNGKETYREYENGKGEKVQTHFENNLFGSGFGEGDWVVGESITLTTSKALTIKA